MKDLPVLCLKNLAIFWLISLLSGCENTPKASQKEADQPKTQQNKLTKTDKVKNGTPISSSLKSPATNRPTTNISTTNGPKVSTSIKENKQKALHQHSNDRQNRNDQQNIKLDLSLDALTLSKIEQNSLNKNCEQGQADCLWQDKKATLPNLFKQKEDEKRFSLSGDIERDGEKELLDIKAIKGGEVSIKYKFE